VKSVAFVLFRTKANTTNNMKNKAFIFLFLMVVKLWGQGPAISPQVINSAGKDHGQIGSSGIFLTDNIGEPFTTSVGAGSNFLITQGFLQPLNGPTYNYSIMTSPVTCMDKKDGKLDIIFNSVFSPYTLTIYLLDSVSSRQRSHTNIDSLSAGNYTLEMYYTYGSGINLKTEIIRTPIVINNHDLLCKITIYTGFTPNGDGVNDVWRIRNINEFPKNRVTIYNRWGIQVFDAYGYDNESNVWPYNGTEDQLIPSTYFYIIDLGDGSKPYKGWVEVIKN
jgi:gliding motility-associated-like protein